MGRRAKVTDHRERGGMLAVWLIIALLVIVALVLSYAIASFINIPAVGGILGILTGVVVFKMVQHILRLAKEPDEG